MKQLKQEYIGLVAEIINAKNSTLNGLKGQIIDETKNTFVLITNNKEKKRVLKKDTVFMIDGTEINGNNINKRPEERIKLRRI